MGWDRCRVVFCVVAVALVASGCSIKQEVNRVKAMPDKEVCIVENPDVKKGFIEAYQRTLRSKGCKPRVLEKGASLVSCPTTSTYEARWTWDLAIYMSYTRIQVYQEGAPVGDALYDSTYGGGRMDKFINAEEKVNELVRQLYPTCLGVGMTSTGG